MSLRSSHLGHLGTGLLWHRKADDDDDSSSDSSLRSFSADEVAELEDKTGRLAPDMVDSLLDEITEQALESERQVAKGLVHVLEESLREEHALGVGHDTLDTLAEKFAQLLAYGDSDDGEGQTVSRKSQATQTTEMIELMDRREAKLENGCSCIVETVHQMISLLEQLQFHWQSFSGPGGVDAFLHKSMGIATEMEGKAMRLIECTEAHRAACLSQCLEYVPRSESVTELTDFQKYLDLDVVDADDASLFFNQCAERGGS
ncbi:Hypothetical predicted protein [Cloeon dipterum]|uniref:Uncharacterized protein n=1 Tax=Cloeon dipterum TaxID=197152 RepID=A0A8S1DIA4_9INSE|nr:Hypothetical predicted protein [Cloeon dipterum]